tara:strand:- start:2154 stop:2915 length:762 start_codon:yes stop_codon:yes gene_type:complete
MAFTVVAYAESLDPAAAFVNFAGVPDDHVTVTGDDIFVPSLNQLIAVGIVSDLTVASQARLRAPSLIERGHEEYIQPINTGLVFDDPPTVVDRSQNPLQLVEDEALQLQILSNPSSAAVHYGMVLLSDGVQQPVTGQQIQTIRATAAITQSAVVWVNGALTFPVSLRAGRYAVVGARVIAANAAIFRLRFQGGPWRPGGPCVVDEVTQDNELFRGGKLGVWGEFDHRSPPTLDVIGVTNTAQEVLLDLIYLGA